MELLRRAPDYASNWGPATFRIMCRLLMFLDIPCGDCTWNVQKHMNRVAPFRFGSVTVWGWNGSTGSGFRFRRFLCKQGFSAFQYSLTAKDGSVPVSVPGKRFRRFRFRFRFREKRFRRFRFPVPVRFLSHPVWNNRKRKREEKTGKAKTSQQKQSHTAKSWVVHRLGEYSGYQLTV